jgi:hypothetical protein
MRININKKKYIALGMGVIILALVAFEVVDYYSIPRVHISKLNTYSYEPTTDTIDINKFSYNVVYDPRSKIMYLVSNEGNVVSPIIGEKQQPMNLQEYCKLYHGSPSKNIDKK